MHTNWNLSLRRSLLPDRFLRIDVGFEKPKMALPVIIK
jgi:hypothetical protein